MKRNLLSPKHGLVLLGMLFLAACSTTPTNKYGYVPTHQNDIASYNPNDYGYAYAYFKSRAEAGDPVAQDNVGKMYADGRGVQANPEQSVAWFSKAATQHNPDAEMNLAVAYLYGRGTTQDLTAACYWLNQAKHDGNKYADDFYSNNC
jgi:TPR repeat protein